MKKTITNWYYKGRVVKGLSDLPPATIGFIYRIENLSNGMYYYGRKEVVTLRKPSTKAEKATTKKVRDYFEAKGWLSYFGSNKTLKADVAKGHKIKKEIIVVCKSKAEITYNETKQIICNDCLYDQKCYNDWFSAKVFRKNL